MPGRWAPGVPGRPWRTNTWPARYAPATPADRTAPAEATAPAKTAPVPAGTPPSGRVPAEASAAVDELNLVDGCDLVGRRTQACRRNRSSLRAAANQCPGECERQGRSNDHSIHWVFSPLNGRERGPTSNTHVRCKFQTASSQVRNCRPRSRRGRLIDFALRRLPRIARDRHGRDQMDVVGACDSIRRGCAAPRSPYPRYSVCRSARSAGCGLRHALPGGARRRPGQQKPRRS